MRRLQLSFVFESVILDRPDAYLLVGPVRGDMPPIREEGDGEHRRCVIGLVVSVIRILCEELAVIHLPQPDPAIGASRHQVLAAGREGEHLAGIHWTGWFATPKLPDDATIGRASQLHRGSALGEQPPVRAEGDARLEVTFERAKVAATGHVPERDAAPLDFPGEETSVGDQTIGTGSSASGGYPRCS
jgi:hypothetical protein